MTGTNGSTSGLRQTIWWHRSFSVRLAAFALVVSGLALLIIRIDTSIWRQQERLEEKFEVVRAEKFYFGVSVRVALRQVRQAWLDLYLTCDDAHREAFGREALELQRWLRSKESIFSGPDERARFRQLEAACSGFVAHLEGLMRTREPQSNQDGFAAVYQQVRSETEPVFKLCDADVKAERKEFNAFLQSSDQGLADLQRLLVLSLVLLVGSAVAVTVMAYRGMIAPLRAQLNESQEIIERQEKLAALGTLGAGVAHEIRNPLQAIKFRLFSLKRSLPAGLAEQEDAKVIGQELDRLDRIVKDFLRFARPSEPELVRVAAEGMLREVHDLLQSQLEKSGIELRLEALPSASVQADPEQLKQVLINLVQNAAESIGTQGTVTLGLKLEMARLGGAVQAVAVLAVTDTGKGIAPEVQKRLFDPFFTTKADGTGLGLAIAARIAELHGGLLRYRTQVNRGTTFEMVLPRIEEPCPRDC